MVKHYALILLVFIVCISCSSDNNYIPNNNQDTVVNPNESPVVFNLENIPYQTLSEYNFFQGNIKDLIPVNGVLPYDLNSTLFSDYAKKKRFIWMPVNSKAEYINDFSPFDFPIGTILIKNFYYENVQPNNSNQVLETRLMIKKESEWIFAKYVWNDSQTEATFTEDGSTVNLEWVYEDEIKSVNYRIPSKVECFTCHNKFGTPVPIGPKPQNINRDFQYNDGIKNQLTKWVEQGYLDPNFPESITSTVNWKDTTQPLDLRARSYVDINCAHCHSEESYCEYRPMRFAFHENEDLINMGVCVTPDTNIDDALTHIIAPNDPNKSVVLYRMNSTLEENRMPLLGRTLKHHEGVRLIEQWINSLTAPCQ